MAQNESKKKVLKSERGHVLPVVEFISVFAVLTQYVIAF